MEQLRQRRTWIIVAVTIAVPVLAVAWYLGSPLLFDKAVEEEFPFAAAAAVPPNMTRSEVEGAMATMAKMDSPMEKEEAMTDEMAKATVVKTGEFKNADSFHKGQGKATIYSLPDGTHVLRLESFRVTNGPELHLVLTPHPDPDGRDAVHQAGYADLGKIKGNIGNQNYPIPASVDASSINAVVVYCKPFHVIFSVAGLR